MENNKLDNVLDMFFDTDEEETQSVEHNSVMTDQVGAAEARSEDDSQPEVNTESKPADQKIEEVEDKTEGEKQGESFGVDSNGQFSLFGNDEVVIQSSTKDEEKSQSCEDGEDKSKSKNSGKKPSSKTSTNKTSGTKVSTPAVKPKRDQNFEVSDEWSIHYALHSFRVTDFINPFPASGKVSLEEIRIEMEKEFFEMTKERTKWDYDEDLKRLYPDVSGTSKGCGV